MNTHFYPAVFTYDNNDNYYKVNFIDLPGCSTLGNTISEAYLNAKDALGLYLSDLENFPKPTIPYSDIKLHKNELEQITLIKIYEC